MEKRSFTSFILHTIARQLQRWSDRLLTQAGKQHQPQSAQPSATGAGESHPTDDRDNPPAHWLAKVQQPIHRGRLIAPIADSSAHDPFTISTADSSAPNPTNHTANPSPNPPVWTDVSYPPTTYRPVPRVPYPPLTDAPVWTDVSYPPTTYRPAATSPYPPPTDPPTIGSHHPLPTTIGQFPQPPVGADLSCPPPTYRPAIGSPFPNMPLPTANHQISQPPVGADLSSPPPMYRPTAWGGPNTETNYITHNLWPSLPANDNETAPTQDWESARRHWQRRQRIDQEQRGAIWNE